MSRERLTLGFADTSFLKQNPVQDLIVSQLAYRLPRMDYQRPPGLSFEAQVALRAPECGPLKVIRSGTRGCVHEILDGLEAASVVPPSPELQQFPFPTVKQGAQKERILGMNETWPPDVQKLYKDLTGEGIRFALVKDSNGRWPVAVVLPKQFLETEILDPQKISDIRYIYLSLKRDHKNHRERMKKKWDKRRSKDLRTARSVRFSFL